MTFGAKTLNTKQQKRKKSQQNTEIAVFKTKKIPEYLIVAKKEIL